MKYDYLNLADFSYETRKAIVDLYQRKQWQDIDTDSLIQHEHAALMWFRLRQVEDTPENFPKGKWATLQHLESLVDRIVREE